MPLTVLVWGSTAYLLFVVDDCLPMAPGPGGGGEGIIALIVWGLRAAACVVSAVCLMLVPRRVAWHVSAVVLALLISITLPCSVFLLRHLSRSCTINVHVTDAAGSPLAATVQYRLMPHPFSGLTRAKERTGTCATDAAGNASFPGETFYTLYLTVTTSTGPRREQQVNIYRMSDAAASAEMHWATPATARRSLAQQFHERITGGKKWDITVEFALDNTIAEPLPYRTRLAQMVAAGPQRETWPYAESTAFANLGGFEFAPAIAQTAAGATSGNCIAVGQLKAMLSFAGDAEWILCDLHRRRGHYPCDDFQEILKRGPLPADQVKPLTEYLAGLYQRILEFYATSKASQDGHAKTLSNE
jgi:hypothetical protein